MSSPRRRCAVSTFDSKSSVNRSPRSFYEAPQQDTSLELWLDVHCACPVVGGSPIDCIGPGNCHDGEGVCGKPRQIALRLTASHHRKHAFAREREERQSLLNKCANHREKAGHASPRMLRQQVTRHSGGFKANFSVMKMLGTWYLGPRSGNESWDL